MKRLFCTFAILALAASAPATDLTPEVQDGAVGGAGGARTFCDGDVKDLRSPDLLNGLASSDCFAGVDP